jgi:hypothetical protein
LLFENVHTNVTTAIDIWMVNFCQKFYFWWPELIKSVKIKKILLGSRLENSQLMKKHQKNLTEKHGIQKIKCDEKHTNQIFLDYGEKQKGTNPSPHP